MAKKESIFEKQKIDNEEQVKGRKKDTFLLLKGSN